MKAVVHPASTFADGFAEHVRQRDPAPLDDVVAPDSIDAFHDALADADVLVTGTWEDRYADLAPDLSWVQIESAGYDHIPVDTLYEHGIRLSNASGIHAKPIAEHVYGLLLGIERRLFESRRDQTERRWNRVTPHELHDGTIGVIGVGAIGTEIAQKAAAFDLTVLGCDPDQRDIPAVDQWYAPDALHALLADSEYVVLACPLNEQTAGMIGRKELDVVPADGVLVNVGRGGLVDEDALVTALRDQVIRAAALDVFETEPLPEDSPLWELENCFITPHNSGRTPQYAERLAEIFVDNLERFVQDRAMKTEIPLQRLVASTY